MNQKINLRWLICHLFLGAVLGIHVKHEKMQALHSLEKVARSDSSSMHEVIVAIALKNLDVLESIVLDITNPDSSRYSQWMTTDEVHDLTRNDEAVQAVTTWLEMHNVTITWRSLSSSYMKAVANISVWESLLNTVFYDNIDTRRNSISKQTEVYRRCDDYSLPAELTPHISAIFNTCQAPPFLTHHAVPKPGSSHGVETIPGTGISKSTFSVDTSAMKPHPHMREEVSVGSNVVTVSFLNSYYYIPFNSVRKASAKLNQSVFETNMEYYSQQDLTAFQQMYNLPLQTARDIGGYEVPVCPSNACNEGNLDIQYLMGVAQLTTTYYWYVGSASPFLDWIIACASEKYPPQVNSISWGAIEQSESASVMTNFNTQALTLVARGVTVLASSGDNGVAGSGCNCYSTLPVSYSNCACQAPSPSTASSWTGSNSWSGNGYFPSFPATCPYVTAVGATMGGSTVVPSPGQSEIACQSNMGGVITTGGGFSTYFPQPSWQTNAVNAYFSRVPASSLSPGFNVKGRGYPDISLLGVDYQVVIDGSINGIFGTSCSTPAFAAFVTLVNAIRRNHSLPSVGFINQVLYSKKANKKFNDVTSGANSCCAYSGSQATANQALCCLAGFRATSGWDPVTGWGSINFPLFSGLFNESIAYQKTNATSPDTNDLLTLFQEYEWYIIAAIVLIALFILGCIWNRCCSKRPYRPWEQQQEHNSCCVCCACPRSRPANNEPYRASALEMNANMAAPNPDGLTTEERAMIAQSEMYEKVSRRQPPPPVPSSRSPSTPEPSAPALDYGHPENWPLWETEVRMLVEMGFGSADPRRVQPLLAKYMKTPVSMNPASRGVPNERNFHMVVDALVPG